MGRLLRACFFAGLAFAQDAEVCTVSGTVTDARSGAPIQKAHLIVTAQRPTVSDSVSDAAGKFALKLDPGGYTITVVAEGYSRRTQPINCAAAATKLDFALPPEAVIAGRITDDEGHAVPGARISLLRVVYVEGEKKLVQSGGSKAGNDGEYRLDNVAAGSYYLLAVASPDSNKSPYVSVPTYYPSAIEASAAAPIRVRAGELSGTDIRISKARAFSIRGKLHVGDAGELRPYFIKLMPADFRELGIPPQATLRDDQGKFELNGVIPGAYTLLAIGVAGGDFAARVRINIGDSDIEGADLFLAAGNPVSGSLTADDKEQHGSLTARVMLYPLEELTGRPPVANATAGRFELAHVVPSQYRVIPVGLRQAYPKALRVDGRGAPDWIADLTAPGPHSLEIVVGFDPGRVGGFARDGHGDPAPKRLVILVPAGNGPLTTPQYATTYSDDHGRYAFAGVQPGQYKLFAFENVTPGAVQNRQTLRQFETLSAEVQVQPNTVATADVNVIAASATASIE
jgi:Carboxypeptidase regulatory-like domain